MTKQILTTLTGAAILAFTVQGASADNALSLSEIRAIAQSHGMATFEEIERDDNSWEVEGRRSDGRELELDIHARTGAILERDD